MRERRKEWIQSGGHGGSALFGNGTDVERLVVRRLFAFLLRRHSLAKPRPMRWRSYYRTEPESDLHCSDEPARASSIDTQQHYLDVASIFIGGRSTKIASRAGQVLTRREAILVSG